MIVRTEYKLTLQNWRQYIVDLLLHFETLIFLVFHSGALLLGKIYWLLLQLCEQKNIREYSHAHISFATFEP